MTVASSVSLPAKRVKSYHAIRVKQSPTSPWLILFSAPAVDVVEWAGIPQKKAINGKETLGFQRDENLKRVASLNKFCADDKNTIQNPLLLASRAANRNLVRFVADKPTDAACRTGKIEFEFEDLQTLPLLDLLRRLHAELVLRVPSLGTEKLNTELLASLKQRLATENGETIGEDLEQVDADDVDPASEESATNTTSEVDNDPTNEAAEAVLSDESHVLDFWQEVACRIKILEELGNGFTSDELLGFTKDAVISYLYPTIVVDGQHRLRGAVEAAKAAANSPDVQPQIEAAVSSGVPAEQVQRELEAKFSRELPVSLLINDDPAEHVFQFVVVNQKATPLKRSLLGTIVSSTLSDEEADRVALRLKNAGIEFDQSRAIAQLIRDENSPFHDLVERGLTGEGEDLLPWTAFGSLVRMFQHLEGGKLFGEKNDYARIWKNRYLQGSPIVSSWQQSGAASHIECWSKTQGPWRAVFIEFFSAVRKKFGVSDPPDAHNYWGHPRTSNLFNKISLTILAADFFKFLNNRARTLDSAASVPGIVEEWLEGVKPNYFARDWNLSGTKKDSPGIRKQWAKVWTDYRENPDSLPKVSVYRQSASY